MRLHGLEDLRDDEYNGEDATILGWKAFHDRFGVGDRANDGRWVVMPDTDHPLSCLPPDRKGSTLLVKPENVWHSTRENTIYGAAGGATTLGPTREIPARGDCSVPGFVRVTAGKLGVPTRTPAPSRRQAKDSRPRTDSSAWTPAAAGGPVGGNGGGCHRGHGQIDERDSTEGQRHSMKVSQKAPVGVEGSVGGKPGADVAGGVTGVGPSSGLHGVHGISVGSRVIIQGLQNSSHLNGRQATVLRRDNAGNGGEVVGDDLRVLVSLGPLLAIPGCHTADSQSCWHKSEPQVIAVKLANLVCSGEGSAGGDGAGDSSFGSARSRGGCRRDSGVTSGGVGAGSRDLTVSVGLRLWLKGLKQAEELNGLRVTVLDVPRSSAVLGVAEEKAGGDERFYVETDAGRRLKVRESNLEWFPPCPATTKGGAAGRKKQQLRAGEEVEIVGLVADAALNGSVAMVQHDFDFHAPSDARVQVNLGHRTLALKPVNIRRIGDDTVGASVRATPDGRTIASAQPAAQQAAWARRGRETRAASPRPCADDAARDTAAAIRELECLEHALQQREAEVAEKREQLRSARQHHSQLRASHHHLHTMRHGLAPDEEPFRAASSTTDGRLRQEYWHRPTVSGGALPKAMASVDSQIQSKIGAEGLDPVVNMRRQHRRRSHVLWGGDSACATPKTWGEAGSGSERGREDFDSWSDETRSQGPAADEAFSEAAASSATTSPRAGGCGKRIGHAERWEGRASLFGEPRPNDPRLQTPHNCIWE